MEDLSRLAAAPSVGIHTTAECVRVSEGHVPPPPHTHTAGCRRWAWPH
jgi:hypothetical protein